MSAPEETITARDLMKAEFRTIDIDRPLTDSMDLLLDFGDKAPPLPLVAVHTDGTFAGMVTPLALFKALLRKVRLEEISALSEPELIETMRRQLDVPVAEAMVREVPRAYPDDRLFALMKLTTEHRLEFAPVLEDDRVMGIIYVTDIFQAAASLAITHDTEGIRLDDEKDEEIGH